VQHTAVIKVLPLLFPLLEEHKYVSHLFTRKIFLSTTSKPLKLNHQLTSQFKTRQKVIETYIKMPHSDACKKYLSTVKKEYKKTHTCLF